MVRTNFSVIGLFAGVGGIEQGFAQAGFNIIGANEIDSYAAATYKASYGHPLLVDDVSNVTGKRLENLVGGALGNLTVLTGGFPCQPFSVAGHRKGFDDARGNVFWEILRLAEEIQPEVIFLENVKNLTSHDDGKTFEVIKSSLEGKVASPSGIKLRSGYTVVTKVLNAKDFGIPQNRERIYIVAFKNPDAGARFKFPDPVATVTEHAELGDLIDFESKVDEKYYYGPNRPMYEELAQNITETNTIYQWRRKYVRANKSGLCPTLTANMGMGGHNVPLILSRHGIRKLTPQECFALMGLSNIRMPQGIAESRLYKQAGNAVVVPVVKSIAVEILKALV